MNIDDRAAHEYLALQAAYWRRRLDEMDENPVRALDRAKGELRAELVVMFGRHADESIALGMRALPPGMSLTLRGRRPLRVRIVIDGVTRNVVRCLPSNESDRR